MAQNKATLLKFPCEFPVKVMGYASDEFEAAVTEIIKKFDEEIAKDKIEQKLSKDGKYLSITAKIYANSKDHIDDLYWELNAHELVLVTL